MNEYLCFIYLFVIYLKKWNYSFFNMCSVFFCFEQKSSKLSEVKQTKEQKWVIIVDTNFYMTCRIIYLFPHFTLICI